MPKLNFQKPFLLLMILQKSFLYAEFVLKKHLLSKLKSVAA